MPSLAARALYGASQTARVGFFLANRYASTYLAGPLVDTAAITTPLPSLADLLRDIARLFARDWAHIAAGHYGLPADMLPRPHHVARRAIDYFRDLPKVHRRRTAAGHGEVREMARTLGTGKGLPSYYLQNFHFQSDGWLSPGSAQRYDYQVEVLFLGAADAMRRQALAMVADYLRACPDHEIAVADLACGTGRFMAQLLRDFPRARGTAIDLSPAYVERARATLRRLPRGCAVEGALEALPLEDASQDIVTCLFTFHELPAKIRHHAAREIARVLKPGGRYIHLDTLQLGDHPPYDGLLRLFPQALHEPYFADYVGCDLEGLFASLGLKPMATERVFFAKLSSFEKS
ncbi:MAG: class I SAM-dependent methyltransferase [Pseudomonadota bacterium]